MKVLFLKALNILLYLTYLVLTSTFLLFTVLEFVPVLTERLNLQAIRYYAQRLEYKPDPTLVFLPTRAGVEGGTTVETTFVGDIYSPVYGIAASPVPYRATYTSEGFRSNSSAPPFDVLVLGDSYVEFGETDSLTISEQLKHASGFTTFNLGRGWYGPFQYLELFKQYGPTVNPRFAVLCFFDGNDAEDTKQYLRWLKGKSYYTFVLSTKSYAGRYLTAFRDSYELLLRQIDALMENSLLNRERTIPMSEKPESQSSGVLQPAQVHPDLGLIDLNGSSIPMRFNYWNRPVSSRELLGTEEWQALGQVLKDFKCFAARYGVVPTVAFIPAKIQVYGRRYSQQSGSSFLARIGNQIEFENNSHDAFLSLIEEVRLPLVDLLPAFRSAAKEGRLLYYPFDTHWNHEGRQLAARLISESLKNLNSSPFIDTCIP